MQREHSRHSRCQRRRNLWVSIVGPVLLSFDYILVDRGVKCFPHLARRAGKLKHGAPFGRADLKSVRLQPRSNNLDVIISRPELLAELRGCKPLMEVGGRLILLIVEKFSQCGFLIWTTLQN